MKLVMIQGDHIAFYEGRKQVVLVKVNDWDFDVPGFVEDLRVLGLKALDQA
jgi:hypothetical protein